jgi:hypothetical protein
MTSQPLAAAAEVGWRAHANFLPERLQLHRQRHHRLDIATRPDGRQQHTH